MSPFRTMSPSLKNIPVSVPPTCARSSTCETAANWPRKPSRVSMSCTSGLLTTTCGSAAGGAPAELPLALGEYLSHPQLRRRLSISSRSIALRPLVGRQFRSRQHSLSPHGLLFLLSAQFKSKKVNAPFPESDQPDRPELFSRAISRSRAVLEKEPPTC